MYAKNPALLYFLYKGVMQFMGDLPLSKHQSEGDCIIHILQVSVLGWIVWIYTVA